MNKTNQSPKKKKNPWKLIKDEIKTTHQKNKRRILAITFTILLLFAPLIIWASINTSFSDLGITDFIFLIVFPLFIYLATFSFFYLRLQSKEWKKVSKKITEYQKVVKVNHPQKYRQIQLVKNLFTAFWLLGMIILLVCCLKSGYFSSLDENIGFWEKLGRSAVFFVVGLVLIILPLCFYALYAFFYKELAKEKENTNDK